MPYFLGLLVFSILVNSAFAYRISVTATGEDRKRRFATVAIILNLGLLAFFKYAPLFAHTARDVLPDDAMRFLLAVPLPIGISFYTFEGISLIVDTRKGLVRSATGTAGGTGVGLLQRVALFVSFFPHLIAGPILRMRDFFPQIAAKSIRDIDLATCFEQLVVGYFLKLVVADNLATQTAMMAHPFYIYTAGLNLLALMLAYAMQIFSDFAGYSLIALGLAGLFGYRLPANFNWPYLATSFSEFWRRWHMSLSGWLRDYLYFPLGGNRRGPWRTTANLLAVMALGGLWHGAAWNYALWGLWHGAALVLERPFLASRYYRSSHPAILAVRMAVVFAGVATGWLLFRLTDLRDVAGYGQAVIRNWHNHPDLNQIAIILLFSAFPIALHLDSLRVQAGRRTWLNPLGYGFMLFLIATNAGDGNAFIYFRF